jgi:AbrB family looped-hinge helix DNA binding protein
MLAATLSTKYQLAIPKAIRDELGLQAGQRFAVVAKGRAIELVPVRSVAEARGLLRGAGMDEIRDRTDRV